MFPQEPLERLKDAVRLLRDTVFSLSESDDPKERELAVLLAKKYDLDIMATSLCTYTLTVTTEIPTLHRLTPDDVRALLQVIVHTGTKTNVVITDIEVL